MHPPPTRQSVRARLSGALLAVLLCLKALSAVCEEAPANFTPPVAYPIKRYESGWNKNPFTLKTAPVIVAQDSFAKDLAICSYYGDAEDPTVVLVNIKTGERMPLRKAHAGANGMQLKSVKLGGSRKDIVAEVMLGAETSEIRFNEAHMKQMTASENIKVPAGQSPVGLPPAAATGGKPVVLAATTQSRPSASPQSMPKGKAGATALVRPASPSAGTPAKVSSPTAGRPGATAGKPALPPKAPAATSGSTPVPTRRRLNSASPASSPAVGTGKVTPSGR